MKTKKKKPWYKRFRNFWKIKPQSRIQEHNKKELVNKALDQQVRESLWEYREDEGE